MKAKHSPRQIPAVQVGLQLLCPKQVTQASVFIIIYLSIDQASLNKYYSGESEKVPFNFVGEQYCIMAKFLFHMFKEFANRKLWKK